MIDLNTVWFVLLGFLLTGYTVLDGFDLGVGVLHLFTRDPDDRRININAIGPVWDGNEVWLLTFGGALFAAFPLAYATIFSSFYLAFVLLIAALIFRAVSIEFRGKVNTSSWQRLWDRLFGIGSLVPALLFGVTAGNILRGIPLDHNGTFTGSFIGLFNPFALLFGLFTLTLFTLQGAAFMAVKTDGAFRNRMQRWISGSWIVFVVLSVVTAVAGMFSSPHLFDGILGKPLAWFFFILFMASLFAIPFGAKAGRFSWTFMASSVMITGLIGLAATCLYPRLVPSITSLDSSLTIYTTASTHRTLTVMLVIALTGMPFVIGYTVYIYHVFKGKVEISEDSY